MKTTGCRPVALARSTCSNSYSAIVVVLAGAGLDVAVVMIVILPRVMFGVSGQAVAQWPRPFSPCRTSAIQAFKERQQVGIDLVFLHRAHPVPCAIIDLAPPVRVMNRMSPHSPTPLPMH